MKRVAVAETLAELGLYRDVLEQNGIDCVVRNQHLSGALGESGGPVALPPLRHRQRRRARCLLALRTS